MRILRRWKLVLDVTPRAGFNTVDNLIRALEPGKHPRKHFSFSGPIPEGYLAAKFVRNPYARAVSQFTFFGAQNKHNANKTFLEFIDWLGQQNLHRCGNPHYGYQFKKGDDTKFEIFRLENFTAFVDRFNEFGGHQFKISDFGAAHIKQKIQTDKKFHNITFRQMFDEFNYENDRRLLVRKRRNKEHYYLGIEPGFFMPTYRAFYTPEVQDLVYKVFKWDIDNLGYIFEEMTEISKPTELR